MAYTQAQLDILEQMTDMGRKEAQKHLQARQREAKASILDDYDLGVTVVEAGKAEHNYGSGYVINLGTLLEQDPSTLYSYAQVATQFSRDEAAGIIRKVHGAQHRVTIKHFVELARLADIPKRTALIEQMVAKGISANQIADEAAAVGKPTNSRSGGRKPSIPATPQLGLKKGLSLLKQIHNYLATFPEHVVPGLHKMGQEKVDVELWELLRAFQAEKAEVVVVLDNLQNGLLGAEERIGNILRRRGDLKEGAAAASPSATPATSVRSESPDDVTSMSPSTGGSARGSKPTAKKAATKKTAKAAPVKKTAPAKKAASKKAAKKAATPDVIPGPGVATPSEGSAKAPAVASARQRPKGFSSDLD